MKILQVIPYFCFGGAETMCENLTGALLDLGHDVTVVSLYNQRTPIAQRMEAKGIRIRYLDKKLGLDLSMVPKLRRMIQEEKPDVVHTHLDVIKYAVLAARLAGVKKCVHTVHNVAEKEAEGKLQKLVNGTYFRLGWSVPVALSPEVQRSMEAFYGIPKGKIPVAYNGIDLSKCLPKEDYALGETVKLLHIGRFNEQKNHKMLLPVFRSLREEFPNAQLHLLGEGELMEEMKALAGTLGISDAVVFHGAKSDVHPDLHDADLFLLPSRYEGNPMTIIEAMGTALPIVATAVGGVPDMIRDGIDGLLTPCDEAAVTEACRRLLKDQTLRERMGVSAKKQSLRFSAQQMAREYLAVYEG